MSDKRRAMSENEIESLLQRLPRPSPSAAVWQRVSADARAAEGETRQREQGRRWLGWGVALAAAACCVMIPLYQRGPQELTAPQVARSVVQGQVEPATGAGTGPASRDEVGVGGPERTASRAQKPPARSPAEVEIAAAEPEMTPELPAVTASDGGPLVAETAEAMFVEADSAGVQVSEPAEEETSSYFAVVSLPDGRRSVLRQSAAASESGEGTAIRLEYTTIPAEYERPGVGG